MRAVEERAGEGSERDEREVREGDSHHVDCKIESTVADETRSEQKDHKRRRNHTEGRHERHRYRQISSHGRDEGQERRARATLAVFGKHRHKGLRKRAFGKEATEEIGRAKGHEKDVCRGASAEQVGERHVPSEARKPGQHGHRAHHAALGGDILGATRFCGGLAQGLTFRWGKRATHPKGRWPTVRMRVGAGGSAQSPRSR